MNALARQHLSKTPKRYISSSFPKPVAPRASFTASYHKMATDRKNPKYGHLPLSTSGPLECALTGTTLLNHPYFNKGSAFTAQERRDFNL